MNDTLAHQSQKSQRDFGGVEEGSRLKGRIRVLFSASRLCCSNITLLSSLLLRLPRSLDFSFFYFFLCFNVVLIIVCLLDFH